jgi:hypothetical protein
VASSLLAEIWVVRSNPVGLRRKLRYIKKWHIYILFVITTSHVLTEPGEREAIATAAAATTTTSIATATAAAATATAIATASASATMIMIIITTIIVTTIITTITISLITITTTAADPKKERIEK